MEQENRVRPDRSRRALLVGRVLPIVVVTIVVVVGAAVLLPALGRARPSGPRSYSDDNFLKGIHQGMVLWAKLNQGRYPEPSVHDAAGATIALGLAEDSTAKDTTANIMAMMVFNGFFTPELVVSVAENNPNIRIFDKYAYEKPPAAADPANALWDPAMRADFTTGESHISYAHMPLGGARRALWTPTTDPSRIVLGERGPEVSRVSAKSRGAVEAVLANPRSNTIQGRDYFQRSRWGRRITGTRQGDWKANVVMNDGSVRFVNSIIPEGSRLSDDQGVVRPDVLFYDEPTDPKGTNNMLGIWVKAGPKKEDFKAVWD